ncbi:hypothetical protein [uncultured Anaerococcus sp.]|uniref:hypothetical protein n=1 Tax=uncultured Anaerococcus sp. TaxID=293428 RepID=UPI00288BAE71|nr:hypothetical protein [uncultured Anaerococcus sp.]
MDLQQLENLSDKLENETYSLIKAIEALLYKLFPTDPSEATEQSTAIAGLILQQAKLMQNTAEELNGRIFKLRKESGNAKTIELLN